MPSNAEILAQLEKLSEAQERDVPLVEGCWHVAEALGARGNGSRIMKLVDSFTVDVDFSTILAAVRRWVKIEEAARAHVDKRRDDFQPSRRPQGAPMKPDHDAAKKWAESLGPENTFGVCGPDMLNLARAYLDLLSREQRAVELLRELLDTAKPEPGTDYQKSIWARSYAFLAERGEV